MELQRLFGANVRHHRKAKGWTLEQLSDQTGISRETIGKIERGVAAPLFETAEKIAVALNVPAPVLFGANAVPGTGERARLLTEINGTLSRMNADQLDRAARMLKAFVG
ncbi:DNA-binding XRE family transcriptional regulator [Ciceribacter lividus]|uniref:DNA-binding XRE family transcriptional regulator n=1 Tax=Ciceribacter lividus TaxID=1197950 RepID=A0A6I7HN82_9HYPH|nr:helix-turn-helix transcriptional regulator [Ciceribacter lividus]RCW27149.1 DNA-binding XRE family transcriptional regulator [Ciceribacter lividus]